MAANIQKHRRTDQLNRRIAQRQRWLYVYAAIYAIEPIIGIIRVIHTPFVTTFSNTSNLSSGEVRVIAYTSFAFDIALQLAIVIYLATVKNVKRVLLLLKILLALDALGLLAIVFKPHAYTLLESAAQVGFTLFMIKLLQDIKCSDEQQEKSSKNKTKSDNSEPEQPVVKTKRHTLLIIGAVLSLLLIASIILSEYASYEYKTAVLQSHAFTSSRYSFTIDFPGKPSTGVYQYQPGCNEDLFSYTQYSSSINNDTQVYTINAFSWPIQDVDFINMNQSALKSSLDDLVNSDTRAYNLKLMNDTKEYFQTGQALAEETQFTRNAKGFTEVGYERVFTIGNNEYEIFSQDSGKTAFDVFADSFQYTGPTPKRTSNFSSASLDAACIPDDWGNGSVTNQPSGASASGTTANQPLGIPSPSNGSIANQPSGVPTNGSVSNKPTGQPSSGTVSNTPPGSSTLQSATN